jgi:NAD kinase
VSSWRGPYEDNLTLIWLTENSPLMHGSYSTLGCPKSLTLKMEAVSSSENSVNYFQATRRYISEDNTVKVSDSTSYTEHMMGEKGCGA